MMRVLTACVAGMLCARAVAADAPGAPDLAALNSKFGLADHVKFAAGEGGLPCVDVQTALCTGRVYLQGAHVAAWQPAGEEPVIFMSSKSPYAAGKPFRGGVPVVFPWFTGKADDPKAPGHGVVRTMTWNVASTHEDADGTVTLALNVNSDASTHTWWPGDFEVTETVTMGRTLAISLAVKNTGTSPMKYEEVFHNYFAVKEVAKVTVMGLDKASYLDKTDKQTKTQDGAIAFTRETDRIYPHTEGPLVIVDAGLGRKITLEKTHSKSTVVWNPGTAKAVADMAPADLTRYVCVEAGNVGEDALTVAPGETQVMGEKISVSK